MADDDKRKFEIPWATLLPLLAALAGVIAQFRPLVSARPNIPSEKSIPVTAQQDVDARLWQDPIAVAQKAKAQLDADLSSLKVPEDYVKRHRLEALVETVGQAAVSGEQVLLFAVMLDSGPYIEQGESRLRARQAVLEGLNESGFVPTDSEHIGFVTIPGKLSPAWDRPEEKPVEDGALLIPWEECRADSSKGKRVYPPGTQRAFVLWLPAASFNPRPLESFANLVCQFRAAAPANLQVKLLGPANSTGLRNMVKEGAQTHGGGINSYDCLDAVEIVSPRATASDSELTEGSGSVQEIIEKLVNHPQRDKLRFRRSIMTDDLVLEHLIAELEMRRVFVKPHQIGKEWVNGDRVIILSEWDTQYGRSLANTFEEKASSGEPRLKADGRQAKPVLSSYRYMHGIDGRLPGDPAKSSDDAQKATTGQAAAVEATEGLDQSDFLRRLARQLKEEDTRSWRKGEGGIRAIGLLGSDIFDKLMILRALRPAFEHVIFFTNNFDAHFERRNDWADVRNLVVASPFGSTLPRIAPSESPVRPLFEQGVAPFRDNNQTSMFFGTLVATGRFDDTILKEEIARQPRLFEIGRRGSYELSQTRFLDHPEAAATNNPHWFGDWISSASVRRHLLGAVLMLVLLAGWIGLSRVDPKRRGGGSVKDRFERFSSSTPFFLICVVPIVVLWVASSSQRGAAVLEPLAFFSGISIWPSEMLRLIALLLAIHFMVKASFDLRANEREITGRFFSDKFPLPKWQWRLGLRRWQKEYPDWTGEEAQFSAREAWLAYLQRNHWWPRCVRVGALFLIYFTFSFAVFSLFPRAPIPARGPVAFSFDQWTIFPTVIAMMILTFYVVDAIRLNSNFIRIFTRGVTEWEPKISPEVGRTPPLTLEDLSRYLDISFVAQRTEVVARLIWYPLIILTIMFVARSSLFDYWTWPISLILIYALNAMWAIGSAIFLRRSAEQLRETSIRNLQLMRVKTYATPEKRQMFDELIAEVRAVKKGAFAPLTEQPFIRAILYPSGGLGLLAVGQRLLDFF